MGARSFVLVFLFVFSHFFFSSSAVINVHLVPYSTTPLSALYPNVDAGRISNQNLGVKNNDANDFEEDSREAIRELLLSVVDSLDNSLTRKFTLIQTDFSMFHDVFNSLSTVDKQRIKRAVKDTQLFFAQGDIALPITSASDMRELTGYNRRILRNIFGGLDQQQEVFVNIDSKAGVTVENVKLLKEMNFSKMVFSDAHYLIKSQFIQNKHLQFIYGNTMHMEVVDDDIIKELMQAFDFEDQSVRQVTNTKKRSEKLVKLVKSVSNNYRTTDIMIPFGGRFKFKDADIQFSNLEKLFQLINSEKKIGIEVKFSSFDEYFASLKQSLVLTNQNLPIYDAPLVPFALNSKQYTSGIYSNQIFFKQKIYEFRLIIRTCRTQFAFARTKFRSDTPAAVDNNENSMWFEYLFNILERSAKLSHLLLQHDISAGIISDNLIQLLTNRIDLLAEELTNVMSESLELLLLKSISPTLKPELTRFPNFEYLNSNKFTEEIPIPLVLFNSQLTPKLHLLRMELPKNMTISELRNIEVKGSSFQNVKSQVYKSVSGSNDFVSVLSFIAEVPAMGFTTYFISSSSTVRNKVNKFSSSISHHYISTTLFELTIENGISTLLPPLISDSSLRQPNTENAEFIHPGQLDESFFVLENELLKFTVDPKTGMLLSVRDKINMRTTETVQNFVSFPGSRDPSFISLGDSAQNLLVDVKNLKMMFAITDGPLSKEITITFSEKSTNVFRFQQRFSLLKLNAELLMLHGLSSLQASFVLASGSDEVVMQLRTSMTSNGELYTSTSDGSFAKRKSFGEDVPLESNLFPVESAIGLRDFQATPKTREGQLLLVSALQSFSGGSHSSSSSPTSDIDILISRGSSQSVNFEYAIYVGTPKMILSQIAMKRRFSMVWPMFPLASLDQKILISWREIFHTELSFLSTEFLRSSNPLTAMNPPLDIESFQLTSKFSDEVEITIKKHGISNIGFENLGVPSHAEHSFLSLLSWLNPSTSNALVQLVVSDSPRIENDGVFEFRPGEVKSFSVSLLPKLSSTYSTELNDNNKLPQKSNPPDQNGNKDVGSVTNHKARVDPDPEEGITLDNSKKNLDEREKTNDEIKADLLETISQDEKLLKILEARVKRAKKNVEELKGEFGVIASQSVYDEAAKKETLGHIKKAEETLKEATDQLVDRMQHMKETQQKLDMINFRLQALNFDSQPGAGLSKYQSYQQMREWEATLHGLVTGAGGMLVMVLLYNLMCVRMKKLPRVPIKWVGFGDTEDPDLPIHKEH